MKPQKPASPPDNIALNPQFREHERALLRALLQATDDGILLSGLDRQDLIANRRLGELFDMAPQDIVEAQPEEVGANARARVRDPELFEAQVARTYADPTLSYTDEIELLTEPPRVLRRFTGPVCDGAGQPIGRLWTFLDISETKRLQQAVETQLRNRTEDYTATAEVLAAINEMCRVATQRQTLDQLLRTLTEVTRPLLGQECAAILLVQGDEASFHGIVAPVVGECRALRMPCHRDPALAAVLTAHNADASEPITLHANYTGFMARKLHCRSIGVAALCGNGNVMGALVVGSRDATMQLDTFRFAHFKALADQVALAIQTHRWQSELNAALDSLQQAQRQMVEIEKLRTAGTLAASVAHDIRNILTAMQIEMDAETSVGTQALRAQVNRFSALTHRLLAFAKPGVLESRPTSLQTVIASIVHLIEGQAKVSDVEVMVHVESGLPRIAADASQLEHLFVNLCLNSIQAMSRGGELTISVVAHEHWIEVRIQDTGCGIASESLDRIFDPFFTTRATGFGLGLFSCKRIVEEHGGQITVQSVPGTGSCFCVMFPIAPL